MDTQSIQESRFLNTLRQSELLSDEEIDPFVEKLDVEDDAGIAREFLKAQLLTPFQAKYVLHGRWRGLVIGDYRILEPLSVGGMGEVYLAREKDADKSVAIKILRTELREIPKNIERFRLEAFAVMTLKHPNLLHGIEYGTIDQTKKETHYLITEFVHGPNLYELTVIRRQLPWQQACDLIAQAARGLQCAHENQFVHRDVKPGNIIISSSGVAKVVYFGLAQYRGPNESFSFSLRKRRGTQRYAAPEQTVMDEPIDHRADIYSLGCTLYFALTGRPPSENASNLFPRSRHVMERLKAVRKDLPEDLVAVVRKMLRRAPEHRIESAIAVSEALEPFAKRMSVDVNFPALLRAREKARRSQSAIANDATAGLGTTLQGDSRQNESDESDLGIGENLGSDLIEERREGAGRFSTVYRRQRQHVDRLRQRVEALESELRVVQERESELSTMLNVKSIEQDQLVTENRKQSLALNKKHEELQAANQQIAEQANEIQTLTETVAKLQSELEEAEHHRSTLEQFYVSTQNDKERRHKRLRDRLLDRIESAVFLYRKELAKRRRASASVKEWFLRARGESEKFGQAEAEIENLKRENQAGQHHRDQIQQRLNEARQMSQTLSADIATIFSQISTDELEDTFVDSYEQACEKTTDRIIEDINPDNAPQE